MVCAGEQIGELINTSSDSNLVRSCLRGWFPGIQHVLAYSRRTISVRRSWHGRVLQNTSRSAVAVLVIAPVERTNILLYSCSMGLRFAFVKHQAGNVLSMWTVAKLLANISASSVLVSLMMELIEFRADSAFEAAYSIWSLKVRFLSITTLSSLCVSTCSCLSVV